jgi:hypothetical protein
VSFLESLRKSKAVLSLLAASSLSSLGLEATLNKAYAQTKVFSAIWDKSSDNPTGYLLYYGEPNQSPNFMSLLHSSCGNTTCSVTIPALDGGKVWEFYAKAYLTAGGNTQVSNKSNIVSYRPSGFSPPDKTPPQLTVNQYALVTTTAALSLTGTATDDSDINVLFNDKWVTSEKGSWNLKFNLNKGGNPIKITVEDVYGNQSVHQGTVFYDPDPPVITDFGLVADETDASQPKLILNAYVFDYTHAETDFYLNNKLVKRLSQLPATGQISIDKLPIEYLIDGPNSFRIVSTDLVGLQTVFEQKVNIFLGFRAVDGAETYANDAAVRQSWINQTPTKGSLEARLSQNQDHVTDGDNALLFSFNQPIQPNKNLRWDKMINPIDITQFLEFGLDIYNPRDGGDIALKLELRNNSDAGFTYYSGAPLAHGMNKVRIPYDQLKDSGTINRKAISIMSLAFFNRNNTQTIVPSQDKDYVTADKIYFLFKDLLENAERYNTNDEAKLAWKNMTPSKGSLDAILTTDPTRISEGTKALQFGFAAPIEPNKCIYWDYTLGAPLDINQFTGLGFDVYNPRSGGDVAPKIEFHTNDGQYVYLSCSPLANGMNKIRVDASVLKQSGIVDPTQIAFVRFSLFNRKSTTIVPTANQDYVTLDNMFFKPRIYYLPPAK